MRYFLMVYDRTAGTILELKEFEGERRAEALKERLLGSYVK